MTATLTISYDLHPPQSTSAPNLVTTKSRGIPVQDAGAGQKRYYESLRGSIREAKTILGEELTAWRDAVGNGEQSKESKKIAREDDDEGDDVED